MSQWQGSMGPSVAPPVGQVSGPSSTWPAIPVLPTSGANAFSTLPGPPSVTAHRQDSDSDPDVQSLTIPFRSGSSSSENFLPMVSTDDTWISELEFRFVSFNI